MQEFMDHQDYVLSEGGPSKNHLPLITNYRYMYILLRYLDSPLA